MRSNLPPVRARSPPPPGISRVIPALRNFTFDSLLASTGRTWMNHRVAVAALVSGLSVFGAQDLLAQRSGFIIGFGIGPGVNTLSGSGITETDAGVATDFKIGAQVSPTVQVYYLTRAVIFFPEDLNFAAGGMSGLGITYLLPSSPKVHLSGGVGVSTYAVYRSNDSDRVNGFGLTFGFGYEFADLWLVDFGVAYGRPSESGSSLDMFDIRAGISILSH